MGKLLETILKRSDKKKAAFPQKRLFRLGKIKQTSTVATLKTKYIFSISEAAKFLGVSPDTLRNWEEKGKLIPQRTKGGSRRYRLEQLKKVLSQKYPSLTTPVINAQINQVPQKTDQLPQTLTAEAAVPETAFDLLKNTFPNKEKSAWSKADDFIKNQPIITLTPLSIPKLNNPIFTPKHTAFPNFFKVFLISGSLVLLIILLAIQRPGIKPDDSKVLGISFSPINFLVEKTLNTIPFISKTNNTSLALENNISNVSKDVLAEEEVARFLEINADTTIRGNLTVDKTVNGLSLNATTSGILIADIANNRSLTVTGNVVLNQSLAISASPTFSTLTLSSTSKQLILGTNGTLTWTPTAARTLTLPDATDTLVGKATTDTLTNKTISGSSNTISNIQSSALSGSYTGITGLGTISTGTWNGTKIGTTYGGTGLTTYTTGNLIYSSASDTLAKLAIGTTGQVLTVSGGVPTWADASGGVTSVNSLTGALTIAGGGINAISASGTTVTVTGTEADTLAAVTGRGATTSTAVTFSSTINSNTFSSTALTFAGASPAISASTAGTSISLDAGTSGKVTIAGTSTGDVDIAGGSTGTGCTINNATGNLTCSGDIAGGSTGTAGFWTRTGTSLAPATAGDSVTTTGGISTTGSGTLSIAGSATFSSTINSNTFTSTALTFAGSDPVISGPSSGSNTISLNSAANGSVLLAGGSGSTGCTIDDATGNFTCSGTISSSGSSDVGFWSRNSGTSTLSPVTSGDHVSTTGNISTTGTGTITSAGLLTGQLGLTITGAAVSLNASSNYNTNINTGTSTGAISIGNSLAGAITLQSSAASVFHAPANTATAFRLTDGTNAYQTIDTRTTLSGVSAFTFAAGTAPTIASASNAEYTTLTATPPTLTLTGTTQVTSQMDSILFNAPTLTDASALTIDKAATLTINGAPISGASGLATLTDSYALKINAASVDGGTGTVTNAYGLYVDAPTGAATNNYMAYFNSAATSGTNFAVVNTGVMTGNVVSMTADSLTSGTLLDMSIDGLAGGKGINLASTSTALTTGNLFNLDWSPTGSTNIYATGDILSVGTGNAYAFVGNLFNVKSQGSSVFSISDAAVTASLPTSFTAPGDVSIAYDINMTNPTASYIKSNAPLYITAGKVFNSSDLVLSTYNQGSIILSKDLSGSAVTNYVSQISASDTTANANTNYGLYSSITHTGNAAKTGIGLYSTLSTSSTTADTLIAADLATSTTGVITTGTRNIYGLRSQPASTAASTGGTTNVYGIYSKPGGVVGAGGTINSYGLYVANGTMDGTGTSTNTGLYVETPTSADFNYTAIFAGGNVGIGTATPAYKLDVATSTASDRGINIANTAATGTNYGVYSSVTGAATTNYGGYFVSTGATTDYGLAVAALTGATSTGLDIGALSGATANLGINVGAISGAGTSSSLTTGANSATGATAYQLDLGAISGANATSHTGINIGNISGTTAAAAGITLGTLTGGTTTNYQISTGTLTGIASATNAQLNLGTTVGAASATTYGINIGALSGAGTASYGINVGANSSTATTNYGINTGAISGAGTNNYGINIGAVSGAGTGNYALMTNGGQVSITDTSNTAASLVLTNNTATTIGNGANTSGVIDLQSTSLTTGNFMNIELNALSSGKGLNLTSTSTALSSGSLASIDWSPSGSTNIYATGDILSVGTGNAYAFVGNLFNVKSQGSSVFSVSDTAVTASIPASFTAPGDVSIAYDVNMTNPTASYIKSQAPLYLTAGETFNSSDLVLTTYNQGSVILNKDLAGSAVTNYVSQISASDITANANTDYGMYSSLTFTGNAAKTGVGYYSTLSSSSTTGDTLVAFDAASSTTGVLAGATTRSVYGLRSQPSSTAASTAGTTNVYGIYSKPGGVVGAGGTINSYGLYVANGTMDTTGTSTNYGIYVESPTGADTNYPVTIAAISGTGTAAGITTGDISSTGATAYHLNLGAISGANATSHTGINIGNISGTTAAAAGITLGTLTGGTTTNYQISTGTLTGIASATNAQLNLGTTVGAASATTYGINIGALSGAGTASYGINVGANSSTATTNYGINIGALSGAGTNNYGLYVGAVSGADNNYAAIFAGGNVGIGITAPAGLLDISKALSGTPSTTGQYLSLSASTFTDSATAGSGTATSMVFNSIAAPTLAATNASVTTTNAATLYVAGAPAAGTNQTISNAYALWIDAGAARFDGPVAFGAQQTLTVDSTTPSVAAGSHFITANANPTLISNFTLGHSGQIIIIEVNDANTDFDCTTSNLNCGGADITTAAAGDIFTFVSDGTNWNLINWMDTSATQTGADLAEMYVSTEKLEAGDVVSIDTKEQAKIHKSTASYQKDVIGIVSTKPGLTLAQTDDLNAYPVALAGRLPVKVNLENGPIEAGDYLTSSSNTGIAMKATKAGIIIGKALESYSGTGVNKILVFISIGYADPNNTLVNLSIDASGSLVAKSITTENVNLVNDISQVNGPAVPAPTSPTILDLKAELASMSARLDKLESRGVLQDAPTATDSAIQQFNNEIATSSASLSNDILGLNTNLDATPSANTLSSLNILGNLSTLDATISGTLKSLGNTFLGNTVVAGNFSIDGTMGITQNSINVIGTSLCNTPGVGFDSPGVDCSGILYLQNSPLAQAVDFFNGKVKIDKLGNINTQGEVTSKKLNISSQDYASASIGSGQIIAGDTQAIIPTTAVTLNSKIFITPTTPTGEQSLIVSEKLAGSGFTITLEKAYTKDIKFDWMIVDEVGN